MCVVVVSVIAKGGQKLCYIVHNKKTKCSINRFRGVFSCPLNCESINFPTLHTVYVLYIQFIPLLLSHQKTEVVLLLSDVEVNLV